MKFSLEQIQAAIPAPALSFINWSAFASAVGYVFTAVVPALVGLLSAVWLGCQIWLFFRTKPWRKR